MESDALIKPARERAELQPGTELLQNGNYVAQGHRPEYDVCMCVLVMRSGVRVVCSF